MKTIKREVLLPNDETVYAVDISSGVTTAYYYQSEALHHSDTIVAIALHKGSPITLVVDATDDNIGINESIELDSLRIKLVDGEYHYE